MHARAVHGSGPSSCYRHAHTLCHTHIAAVLSLACLSHFPVKMGRDRQTIRVKQPKAKAKAATSPVSTTGGTQASLTGEGNPAAASGGVEATASPTETAQPPLTPEASEVTVVNGNWVDFVAKLDGRSIPLQVPMHLRGNARREAFLNRNAAVPMFTALALRDLARQYAEAHEEDALSAYLLRAATASAQLDANPNPASYVAASEMSGRAQREQTVTSALHGIKPLELAGKNNDPRVIRSWLDDLKRALDRFEDMFPEAEWPKAMCQCAILRLRGSLAAVMAEWVVVTEELSWKSFCDEVLKEFSPLDHQVRSTISGLLAPCPAAHGGTIATQITQFKAEMLSILGAEVISSLEEKNPAFLCALVRNGLAASCPTALAKIVKSDHLVKHLANMSAKAGAAGDASSSTVIQPWHKDLQILQRTVENDPDAKGICVVAACTTCGGDHPRRRGGKQNCKLPAADGDRARGTIREQANTRWRDLDNRAKSLSQAQQQSYKKRRSQFIDKLAAISDRPVEASDWERPDQAMANSLQSYLSQKPKAGGKGGGGNRTSAKRKTQVTSEVTAAITAAVLKGLQDKKKKKKKSSDSNKE